MILLKSLLTEGAALTSDFMQKIMQWENSIKAGWNSKKKRWFPHGSVEGGTGTIAYGHKLTASDIASGRFAKGITQADAEKLLKEVRKLQSDSEEIVLNGTIANMERYRFMMGRLEGLKMVEDMIKESIDSFNIEDF